LRHSVGDVEYGRQNQSLWDFSSRVVRPSNAGTASLAYSRHSEHWLHI